MDLPAARTASAPGGGAPSEAQQDMWCHDCVGAFRLPASALSSDSDPTCSRCASTFVEVVEPPPGGGMRIELGADASPEDVVAATRQIVRRLAGADGTRVAAKLPPRPPRLRSRRWRARRGARCSGRAV